MKIEQLTTHPDNERIYSPTDLEELENSLSPYGPRYPLAVTPSNKIISGHRRFIDSRQ
jgi:ParB-like chromosome segregation protein Spo0J